MSRRLWVVAYDITDDRRRASVRRILGDHGKRVQYSVFECWLEKHAMESLRQRLAQHLDETDGIRWYPLCRWCENDADWWGDAEPSEKPSFYLL